MPRDLSPDSHIFSLLDTLPLEMKQTWDSEGYEADATLMLIGPNDYVNERPPSEEAFTEG